MLPCASVVTGTGTRIDQAQTRVQMHVLPNPDARLALGVGFVLSAHQVCRNKR